MAEFYFRYKKKDKKTIKSKKKKKKKQKNLLFCEFKLLVTKDKICGILLKSIIQGH